MAIEHRIQRGDGEVRWVEAHGLAYFEGAGRERKAVRLVGTVEDITERRENAEKANLLTREINHRAKNMLSVVDAIAQRIADPHFCWRMERGDRDCQAAQVRRVLTRETVKIGGLGQCPVSRSSSRVMRSA